VITTKFNIAAVTDILTNQHFRYVFPDIFPQDPLEKFFGQARQQFCGNFYIDIGNVLAAPKVQQLHPLMELFVVAKDDAQRTCIHCTEILDDEDLELI